MSTILTETIDMLNALGHDLEILEIFEKSFEDNPQMGQELIEIFVEIISFWTRAIKFLRRNRFGTKIPPFYSHPLAHAYFHAIRYWPAVKKEFEESSRNIKIRSSRIKEKADAMTTTRSRPAVLLQTMDQYSVYNGQPGATPSAMTESDPTFPCNNIPYARNVHFQARETELQEIEAKLEQEHPHQGVKSYALWGTGGIGKTQVALAYAYRATDRGTEAVFWVNCQTGLSIARSFTEIATVLELEGILADENSEQNRLLVLKWFRRARETFSIRYCNIHG
jgi:hypothetical protein